MKIKSKKNSIRKYPGGVQSKKASEVNKAREDANHPYHEAIPYLGKRYRRGDEVANINTSITPTMHLAKGDYGKWLTSSALRGIDDATGFVSGYKGEKLEGDFDWKDAVRMGGEFAFENGISKAASMGMSKGASLVKSAVSKLPKFEKGVSSMKVERKALSKEQIKKGTTITPLSESKKKSMTLASKLEGSNDPNDPHFVGPVIPKPKEAAVDNSLESLGASPVTPNAPTTKAIDRGFSEGNQLARGGTAAVAKYQEMLNRKTGANLKVDGAWGKNTAAAYNAYQAANKVPKTTSAGTSSSGNTNTKKDGGNAPVASNTGSQAASVKQQYLNLPFKEVKTKGGSTVKLGSDGSIYYSNGRVNVGGTGKMQNYGLSKLGGVGATDGATYYKNGRYFDPATKTKGKYVYEREGKVMKGVNYQDENGKQSVTPTAKTHMQLRDTPATKTTGAVNNTTAEQSKSSEGGLGSAYLSGVTATNPAHMVTENAIGTAGRQMMLRGGSKSKFLGGALLLGNMAYSGYKGASSVHSDDREVSNGEYLAGAAGGVTRNAVTTGLATSAIGATKSRLVTQPRTRANHVIAPGSPRPTVTTGKAVADGASETLVGSNVKKVKDKIMSLDKSRQVAKLKAERAKINKQRNSDNAAAAKVEAEAKLARETKLNEVKSKKAAEQPERSKKAEELLEQRKENKAIASAEKAQEDGMASASKYEAEGKTANAYTARTGGPSTRTPNHATKDSDQLLKKNRIKAEEAISASRKEVATKIKGFEKALEKARAKGKKTYTSKGKTFNYVESAIPGKGKWVPAFAKGVMSLK
jgi:hypothetical protein